MTQKKLIAGEIIHNCVENISDLALPEPCFTLCLICFQHDLFMFDCIYCYVSYD